MHLYHYTGHTVAILEPVYYSSLLNVHFDTFSGRNTLKGMKSTSFVVNIVENMIIKLLLSCFGSFAQVSQLFPN